MVKYDQLVVDRLPKWAHVEALPMVDGKLNDFIVVQAEEIYPMFLKILGYPEKKPDQTQLETCRFCFSTYLKKRIVQKYMDDFTEFNIMIKSEPEKKWALKNYAPGKSTLTKEDNPAGLTINLQGWHAIEYDRIKASIK